jgi:hypothetical protein
VGGPSPFDSACSTVEAPKRDRVKHAEEIMQILEAFDLTQCLTNAVFLRLDDPPLDEPG